MTPAVSYLRVSGLSQVDGTGFDRQASACAALAEAKQLTIIRTFQEQAISGTTEIDQRPAFQEMVSFMLDNSVQVVIVEELGRLAREYRIQEQLLLYLAAKNLSLYASNTGENITEALLSDPMRKALVQIQGIFAELDKSMIVAKLRKGRERTRVTKGRCEGRKPFGHHDGEAAILADMQADRQIGLTFEQIAKRLNSHGVRSRSGKPWRGTVIAKVLRRLS